MQEAFINSEIVRWARERAGESRTDLAKRLKTSPLQMTRWEEGKELPSLHQAQAIADTLRIPFGYLFLPKPPQERLPIADFRKLPTKKQSAPSPELIAVVNDTIVRQQWYRDEMLHRAAEPLGFIGKFRVGDSIQAVAEDIRSVLSISDEFREGCQDSDAFLRGLVRKAENAGILVMRSGVVGNDRYQSLSLKDFRGFALSDQYAPVIFINTQDWRAARIFTLAHELVHIWTGQTGVSNLELRSPEPTNAVEQYCNKVAAETLIPAVGLRHLWIAEDRILKNVERLVKRYKVSAFVVLRKAFDSGTIDAHQYRSSYAVYARRIRTKTVAESGGNFSRLLPARTSEVFLGAVLEAAIEGRVGRAEAADLLGVTRSYIQQLEEKLTNR